MLLNTYNKYYTLKGINMVSLRQFVKNKRKELKLTQKDLALNAGVQPKISLKLKGDKDNKRLTFVGLWGDYILKSQTSDFAFMPEVEEEKFQLL